jgi:hypothetical protein
LGYGVGGGEKVGSEDSRTLNPTTSEYPYAPDSKCACIHT